MQGHVIPSRLSDKVEALSAADFVRSSTTANRLIPIQIIPSSRLTAATISSLQINRNFISSNSYHDYLTQPEYVPRTDLPSSQTRTMSLSPAVWPPVGHYRPSEYCLETGNGTAGFSIRQLEAPAIKKPISFNHSHRRYPLYNHRSVSPDSLYYTHSTLSTPISKKSSRRSAFRRPLPKPDVSPVAFNSSPPPLHQFSTKSIDDTIHYEHEDIPQLASDQDILDDMENWTASTRTNTLSMAGLLSPPGSPLSSFDDLPPFEEDFVLFP
ncbi:hypothetical protein INT44_007962 [Umbelopsis vinacea]|uniref:Uncharacterized protein n=1 Tax=Umbelopsis vinacea TaxID=44442 RepID=A0A8H7PQJ7_9FUNG|nr:hypothetical protein INT44_007962 [Umbelopsis vinacea]